MRGSKYYHLFVMQFSHIHILNIPLWIFCCDSQNGVPLYIVSVFLCAGDITLLDLKKAALRRYQILEQEVEGSNISPPRCVLEHATLFSDSAG